MVKNPLEMQEISGLTPGLGRSPREGNGNPLQYSCPENSMDRGVWRAYSPLGCKESDPTEQITHILHYITLLYYILSKESS